MEVTNASIGDVCEFRHEEDDGFWAYNNKWFSDGVWFVYWDQAVLINSFENRDFLRDFVSLNQIKTTLVSKQLGKSKGWLTQVMNRTDRGDLSDSELQSIMKQLHVDWTQDTFVYVKATKTHSAYRTRPCVYEHAKHKELLQRAFWDGRFVGLKA